MRDESRRAGEAGTGGWWERGHCRGGETAATGLGLRYTARDATSRELAERIAALGARRGTTLHPGAVDPNSVGGGPTVLALPTTAPRSCAGVPAIPAAWRIVPLVETRARVIVRRGAAALVIDPDGGVRIAARPAAAADRRSDAEAER